MNNQHFALFPYPQIEILKILHSGMGILRSKTVILQIFNDPALICLGRKCRTKGREL